MVKARLLETQFLGLYLRGERRLVETFTEDASRGYHLRLLDSLAASQRIGDALKERTGT
jgi:hypothetical protein